MSFVFSERLQEAMHEAVAKYQRGRCMYVTPEHIIYGMLRQDEFRRGVRRLDGDVEAIEAALDEYLANEVDKKPDDVESTENESALLSVLSAEALTGAQNFVRQMSQEKVTVMVLLRFILQQEDSFAAYALLENIDGGILDLLVAIADEYDDDTAFAEDYAPDEAGDDDYEEPEEEPRHSPRESKWRQWVTCINDMLDNAKPLVGREKELDETIRVLCRRDKNNPLHLGDAGVGKTALVYGLARKIEQGEVPERLRGSRIYSVNMGSLVAGSQYRGSFEEKLKSVLEGAAAERNAIIYLDEVHTITGAGGMGSNAPLDAANMLKPWLESGRLRFIGATTYEEFNRHLQQSRSLLRRFQQIDIAEPSVAETIAIVRQLQRGYEDYHGVRYDDDAVEYAVRGTARYLPDRRLPDKALDLIDEAGAWRETHPDSGEMAGRVDKALMKDILSKISKVGAVSDKEGEELRLSTLRERIMARVFGQDEAVGLVSEAVLTGKAGLIDTDKPLASLLFVGPTGVGKTEIAKVLADEMGVELIRFDMSEYTEKHAVAKLIGAPAGYVGYDEGGLLTDAVRRSPECVLLFDEIEKAHPDIYNILLQVMDYARLTDNHGRSTDFRNAVIIMTSNAGAQYASQARIGFGSTVTAGTAMMKEVKRLFKPEFLNRLSATVTFREMDDRMASQILDKKLKALQHLLDNRKVKMTLSEEARSALLREGYSRNYGAREMDRVIASRLKPLLTRSILFGSLAGGGNALIDLDDDNNFTLIRV